MRLRLDPWATEYGSALQLEEEEGDSQVDVDPFVETSSWSPLTPDIAPRPSSIAFIDGVQRIEARITLEEDAETAYGALASVAVGAVQADFFSAAVETIEVHRILAVAGDTAADPIDVPCGSALLTFSPRWSSRAGYLGVAEAIDGQRRDLEIQLGQRMMDPSSRGIVVMDGRLRLFPVPHTAIVGYTKTLHRRYLEPPYAAVLPKLQGGERSPLFQIEEQRPLYSWYMRLASPRPIDHSLAGIVRLETLAAIGKEEAVKLANQTALYLPAFASPRERDPRAPQNLLPIAGLEARLRHEMGDHIWLRREIEGFLYQMAG